MSIRVLRFIRLNDFKTIRYICKDHKPESVLEMPIDQLRQIVELLKEGLCPVCNQHVWVDNGAPQAGPNNPYFHALYALAMPKTDDPKAEIQLVIPEEEADGQG